MARRAAPATADGSADPPPKAKAPAKTRGKGAAASRKAAKGKPSRSLEDVPVDVFYEIARCLGPLDLLHLARTTKTFRRVLMRRSARHIWQGSLQGVTENPLPEMPADMTEPAWIDLLLSHTCHNCHKKGVFAGYWEIRMRLCPPCRKTLECKFPRLENGQVKSSLQEHFPECKLDKSIYIGYPVHWLIPVLVKQDHAHGRKLQNGSYPFRQADFDELKAELLGASSVQERTEVIHRRRKMMEERRFYVWRCLRWESSRKEARSQSRQEIMVARRKAIVSKLRELGWGEELDEMDIDEREEFAKLPIVAQETLLTDRIWANIQDKCVAFMESVRQAHEDGTGGGGDPGFEDWDGGELRLPDQDDWDWENPKRADAAVAKFVRRYVPAHMRRRISSATAPDPLAEI